MLKRLKKTLVITSILVLAFSSISFASPVDENNVNYEELGEPVASATIRGYDFTYENAPQKVKEEYEETCRELNITPKADDDIFIPEQLASTYLITRSTYGYVYGEYVLDYYVSSFRVTGKKSYTVSTEKTVGYGHTTSGNPVHLTQLLVGIRNHPVKTDSAFGNDTYNAVKTCQREFGISADGIVGKSTWSAFGVRL
ncbi:MULTISPECIES: peptidoglycan-binding domain-containing protein [unclassified Clostridioides]|uniref:peptidoglycan-binding domain-containing protein n=1 Tax=unclassified Clostridioides TaxID=2635829 RepID=UPI001D101450|nr:peptidoglycan-binding protein [Clostridioides sp. ES-S-0049-02]MCC0707710.1 peptidoglycan-binding protein [Clostridioides sp. ES-S-0190-01]UDN60789.1 peptidoglycan-binding protein [Clostridioides sp. ES-W-0016-02]